MTPPQVDALDVRLALIGALQEMAELEGKLRADVLSRCDDREQFCESYGCSTLRDIADRIQAIRREARKQAAA